MPPEMRNECKLPAVLDSLPCGPREGATRWSTRALFSVWRSHPGRDDGTAFDSRAPDSSAADSNAADSSAADSSAADPGAAESGAADSGVSESGVSDAGVSDAALSGSALSDSALPERSLSGADEYAARASATALSYAAAPGNAAATSADAARAVAVRCNSVFPGSRPVPACPAVHAAAGNRSGPRTAPGTFTDEQRAGIGPVFHTSASAPGDAAGSVAAGSGSVIDFRIDRRIGVGLDDRRRDGGARTR
jgi:hypothetical protein